MLIEHMLWYPKNSLDFQCLGVISLLLACYEDNIMVRKETSCCQ